MSGGKSEYTVEKNCNGRIAADCPLNANCKTEGEVYTGAVDQKKCREMHTLDPQKLCSKSRGMKTDTPSNGQNAKQ